MTDYECWSLGSHIATALAAWCGAIAAWRGVNTWRMQLLGQNDYNLAKRILKSAYFIENTIRRIRQSVSLDHQWMLWDMLETTLSALDVELLEAKVLWRDALTGAKDKLKECIGDLRKCRRRMSAAEKDSLSQEKLDSIRLECEPILEESDEHDDFSNKVRKAIEAFEANLLCYLDR